MAEELSTVLKEAKALRQAQFLAKYPHPWLLTETIRTVHLLGLRTGSAQTEVMQAGKPAMMATKPNALALQTRPQDFRLFSICKTEKSVGDKRILLGRAEHNDIVIHDRSVSKQHAYFVTHGAEYRI